MENEGQAHPLEVFATDLCEDIGGEELVLKFDFRRATTSETMSTHLWAYSRKKRRSLIGKLEFVLAYDTTALGIQPVRSGKLAVSNAYSFSSIGSKRVFSKTLPDSIEIKAVDLAPGQVKVTIAGPETNSWYDLLAMPPGRANPNVYGPLLRIDLKTDAVCNSAEMLKLWIDTDHFKSTSIEYVDYLCDGGQNRYTFKKKSVTNEAKVKTAFLPWTFQRLSSGHFKLGDTVTIYGEFLNHPDLEINMRCYSSDGAFNFTKILPVPRNSVLDMTCTSLTFVVPHEIHYDKSGFPKQMYPISGFIRPKSYRAGLAYEIVEH